MDGRVSGAGQQADLAICGGGPAGAALACMLAGQPLRVALLEATAPGMARRAPRALALSWSSRRILEACALWPSLQEHVTPVREVHVSAPERFGTLRFDAQDLDAEALGFVVPEDRLRAALWARLGAAGNIEVHCPAELAALQPEPGTVTLRARRDGRKDLTLGAALLAAADGLRSRVRDLAGIGQRRVDYRQTALVMNGRLDRDLEGVACERLTPEGPLAMLPTGGETCRLVYSLATTRAGALQALPAAERLRWIQKRLGRRHGRLRSLGAPTAWPLAASTATGTAARVVLLGDAASVVHPVAAQGFNRCLRELAALAGMLRELPAGADLGAPERLREFEERVRPDRQRVLRMTHCLARLLATPAHPAAAALLPLLRGTGMAALDVLPGLRQHWLRAFSGYYGCQPAWAR